MFVCLFFHSRKQKPGADEMTQWVNGLLHSMRTITSQAEQPGFCIPSTWVKAGCIYSPGTGRVETGGSQGCSLAIQSSWNGELQVHWETLSRKIRWRVMEHDMSLCLHVCMHTQTHTYLYILTPTHTKKTEIQNLQTKGESLSNLNYHCLMETFQHWCSHKTPL